LSNSKITSGTIFVYDPRNAYVLSKDDPGYSTNPHGKPCREIQLETYPSSRDFIDPINTVRPGDIGIILREIGITSYALGYKKTLERQQIFPKNILFMKLL